MNRQRIRCGIALALLALCAPTAAAQRRATRADAPPAGSWSKTVPLGLPPAPTPLRLESADGGIKLSAGPRAEAVLPLSALGEVVAEPVTLASGAVVVVLTVNGPRGQQAGAVVTRVRGRAQILFSGPLDLRGDPGERHAFLIEVADRTGDGVNDVIVAEQTERARVCGQKRTALYPRAVDPRSLALRPVVLGRLDASTTPPLELTASVASPGPDGRPLLAALGRAHVSSLPGVRDLALATPTSALTDGDPATFWHEGRGGGGRGEFATFNWEGGGFPIRALAITPLPKLDPVPPGLDVARTLWLTGHDGSRVRVTLPDAPVPGARYWVVPAQPLAWRCLSVVFEQTRPLRGKKPGSAMLAEVEAYTDLDFGEGEEKLLAALAGSGREASMASDLLLTLGAGVVPRVAEAFDTLPPAARRRALRVLSQHVKSSEPARAALVRALSDAELRERAMDALLGAGEVGHGALAPRVAEQTELGDTVALELAKRAPLQAVDPVLAAISARDGSERPALREALAQSLTRAGEAALAPIERWAGTELATPQSGAAVALALAGTDEPPQARTLAAKLVARFHAAAPEFPELWRLVQASRRLPLDAQVDTWLEKLAREDERWMLRAGALGALVGRGAAQAPAVASAALGDEYPRVRMQAATALAGQASALAQLSALAGDDRWAMVRAAALDALASTPGAVPTLRKGLKDRAQLVRAAAVRGLTAARARDAWPDVKARLLDDGEWPEVVTESITFARTMCIQDASGVLIEVLRRGLKPNAWAPDQDVAMVAFDALLDLGGEAAKAAISAARSPLAPKGFETAIERTKQRKPACESE